MTILQLEAQAYRDRAIQRAIENRRKRQENHCQSCGEWSEELYEFGGLRMCNPCMDAEFGLWDD